MCLAMMKILVRFSVVMFREMFPSNPPNMFSMDTYIVNVMRLKEILELGIISF